MTGLTETEALRRRAAGEGNDRQARPGRSYLRILAQSAFVPVNFVLVGVSALLVGLGLPVDAAVTAVPILLNVGVSVALEAIAKGRLDRLRIVSMPAVRVLRDGRERAIHPRELVRGDIVVIRRGDQVVVDGEVVGGELEVDESLLTGESDPVVRRRGDALLSGTACVSGEATVRATHVGAESYANRLTAEAQASRYERTPLQREVDRVIAVAVTLVVFVGAVVAATSRMTATDLVRSAAVLVALVPQGLAMMITAAYAVGSLRVSLAGTLVQRINAIESMSWVDTLILDKTGTIAAPQFELRDVLPLGIDDHTARSLLRTMAETMTKEDRIGAAIARSLADQDTTAVEVADVIAFSSERRWSGARLATGDSLVLGAPQELGRTTAPEVNATVERWADDGRRVLMLARAQASLRDGAGRPRLPEQLTPIVLIGLAEAVRPDAAETLHAFESDRVDLKVVSGDDPRTVAAVARLAGLPLSQPPLTASELDGLSDPELAERIASAVVVGRAAPNTKARIVRALRDRGRYVGMIGDGVNDILAIRAAQLGIAMQSGSSATRAVADLVLLSDRFAVLPRAVSEGRRIIDGMLGTASLLLTRTLYMLLIVLGAALLRLDFPFTPRNNSLLALITVGLPCLVLVLWAQPVAPPRSVIRAALAFAAPAGLAVAAVALPVYAYYLGRPVSVDLARSALTTVTVCCGILLIPQFAPPRARDGERAYGWRPTILAGAMVAVYAGIAALPMARWFFEIEQLPFMDAAALGTLALLWAAALSLLRRVTKIRLRSIRQRDVGSRASV